MLENNGDMNTKWLTSIMLVTSGAAIGLIASNVGDEPSAKKNSNLLAEVSLVRNFSVSPSLEAENEPEPEKELNRPVITAQVAPSEPPKESAAVPAVSFPGSDVLSPEELLKRSQSVESAPVAPAPQSQSSPPAPTSEPAPASSPLTHIVVSEIRLTGGTGKTTEDFIELYNPGNSAVDLSGWKLRKRTASGAESSIRVFPDGSSIAARGFFLWASSDKGYAASIGADVESAATIAGNNSVALENKDGLIVDSVAWGEGLINPYGEGPVIVTVLEGNQSYERKALVAGACADPSGAGESSGNGCDTDSNSSDFVVRQNSAPQNSGSGSE